MLRCGFYEMDITPFVGCRIPGSFEKRTVEDVTDAPYAKAAVIDNGQEKVAIVCSDILYIYGESYKKILDRICALTDLKRENIMVTATHNHSGGPTDYDLHTDEDKLYVEMAWRKAADAVILANQRLQEATVGFGGAELEGCSFVRDFYMKDGSLCTQPPYRSPDIDRPESEPDPLFTVLSFRDARGNPLGAIANFACHPNTMCDLTGISGEYPCVLGAALKEKYGADYVCVFLTGTCGNINAWSNQLWEEWPAGIHKDLGRKLAEAAAELIEAAAPMEDETVRSVKEKVVAIRRRPSEEELAEARRIIASGDAANDMLRCNAQWILDYQEICLRYGDIPLDIQALRIGECVIHAIPAEVFCHFGHYIRANTPASKNMVASLSNGSCLYILPKELVDSDLYEAQVNSNIYESDTGYLISDTVLKLARKIV